MDRAKFLERFYKALKWYLDIDEAEDIMIDYKDILQQDSEEATALLSENPRELAKKLSVSGSYRQWVLCFSALILFIILEYFFILYIDYSFGMKISVFVFFVGILVSGVSAKIGSGKKVFQEEQKKIRTSCLLLGGGFIIEILMVAAVYFQFSKTMVIANILKCMPVIFLIAGAASVFRSRMKDCRWLSVYAICLALILFCCTILFTLYDMDATAPYGIEQLKVVGGGGILVLVIFILGIRWTNTC